MTPTDKLFRRNLLVAGGCHIGLIVGVILFEAISARFSGDKEDTVQVELIPADLLGDMPKGEGYGRGDWAPAAPAPAAAADDSGPAAQPAETETQLAPEEPDSQPKSAPDPGEITIPKKDVPKPKAETKPKPVTAKKTPKTVKSATPAKATTSKSASTAARTGPVAKGPSAADIRNRFAGALQAKTGGTPYGDGRTAGGGEGRSSVIGSRNGSPDGMVGGVGKGSPFWSYYQHVHDRMYEAWTQPGALKWDKNLVTTVKLVVARDGSVLQARIKNGSGNPGMDDSVIRAVESVKRLNPLPDGLGDTTADITVNFRLES